MTISRLLGRASAIACVAFSFAVSAQDSADATAGKTLFLQQCALCHQPTAGTAQGPGLAKVVGRKAAQVAGFPYSPALRASGLTWDAGTLDRFLASPTEVVPGTSMPVNLPDAKARHAVIAYLGTLTNADRSNASAANEKVTDATAANNDAESWRNNKPGSRHKITADKLAVPFATRSSGNQSRIAPRAADSKLSVPTGFNVTAFATDLQGPRSIRIAPNGDIFIAETKTGRVRVLRAADGAAQPANNKIFAQDLKGPFGIAFYPVGTDPKWVYVATLNSVVRFPYSNGDLEARAHPETIIEKLANTTGGHSTRDLVFSKDGKRLFISVGSGSNIADGMEQKNADEVRAWQKDHVPGATWGSEENRADVLVADPDGRNLRVFATGIRNCVGLTVNPTTGDPWCATNERDGLGDDLVPDYITSVKEHAYYGWPWYYVGSNPDPRLKDARPDLRGKATVPDVLLQAHSAALGVTFYPLQSTGAAAFPGDYAGEAFVALHGSWNRSMRTGYKVVRAFMKNGVATGEYEDFITGFVLDDKSVWGRPVGIAVAHDGSLLVTDDASNTVWRVTPTH